MSSLVSSKAKPYFACGVMHIKVTQCFMCRVMSGRKTTFLKLTSKGGVVLANGSDVALVRRAKRLPE